MSEEKKDIQQVDVFEIKDGILCKNGIVTLCPIAPIAMVPKQGGLVPNQVVFEERRTACNRNCPQSVLFKVTENGKERFVHQTRCVAGWPQQEVTVINTKKNKLN